MRLLNRILVVIGCAVILAILAVSTWLDYVAYRQRFPQAAPWTYLFQPGDGARR